MRYRHTVNYTTKRRQLTNSALTPLSQSWSANL